MRDLHTPPFLGISDGYSLILVLASTISLFFLNCNSAILGCDGSGGHKGPTRSAAIVATKAWVVVVERLTFRWAT